MSQLGMKISRKAQVLGKKIESKSRMLGTKANQALRMSDNTLRKAENTIKNVLIPGSVMLGMASGNPEISAIGSGLGGSALSGIKTIRNEVKPATTVANRLEKLNIRKEGEELLNRIKESDRKSVV